ncbi:MAG TPA: type III pantothenate kinase [Burkholderiales bacterium]|nr:type III pantothenate kinase [Burkholderiales bacterium]
MSSDALILAIDAGNSRVKWALHDGCDFVLDGRRVLAEAEQLRHDWAGLAAPHTVISANVAGEVAATAIAAAAAPWGRQVRFVAARAQQCGVKSRYADPTQLGADRWAALIAARALGAAPRLVICAGTAVTIDALLEDGTFPGGIILPGFDLMHDVLASSTAQLSAQRGEFREFPRSTPEAISSGAIQAICGAIERMHELLWAQAGSEPDIVVSGGSAQLLARHLHRPVQVRDRLVLEGLIRIAGTPE